MPGQDLKRTETMLVCRDERCGPKASEAPLVPPGVCPPKETSTAGVLSL